MPNDVEARYLMTAIMSAVVDPNLWPSAIDRLAQFFGGAAAMAEFHSLDGQRIVLGPRSAMLSDAMLERYLTHYAALCPRPLVMVQRLMPQVQTDRLVGSPKALDANPFYSEFLAADGLRDYIGLRLQLRNDGADVLAVHRLRQDGHATDEELAWMQELAPFLQSAFRARALTGGIILGAEGLIGALAGLDGAVAFLDDKGRVLFQNSAATTLLVQEPGLDWSVALRSWHDKAAKAEDSSAVAIRSPAGRLQLRFLDLRGAMDARMNEGGVYVVLLSGNRPGADPLARYQLTTTERAVLDQLVEGRSPVEIALRQKVSITTVRTHISRLHDKFGVGRTLDVVRLALTALRG